MIFKTLVFLAALYFLSRFISRLLMPAQAKKRSNFTFYSNFGQPKRPQSNSKNLDSIEEADFEEIKDKQPKKEKE